MSKADEFKAKNENLFERNTILLNENERLKKENAELRNNGFTVSAMTEQQLKVAIEKGEQLEKENAELKAEIENDRDLPTVAYIQGAEKQKKKDEKQLTKAKEIIKGLLPMASNFVFGTLPKLDEEVQLYRKAEQFIKEIEK